MCLHEWMCCRLLLVSASARNQPVRFKVIHSTCSSGHCRARHRAPATAQGILGVFLREPLLDWQREARVLQGVRRSKGGARPQESEAANSHISQKVGSLRSLACPPPKLSFKRGVPYATGCFLNGVCADRGTLCLEVTAHHQAHEHDM